MPKETREVRGKESGIDIMKLEMYVHFIVFPLKCIFCQKKIGVNQTYYAYRLEKGKFLDFCSRECVEKMREDSELFATYLL